ncbi:MAG: PAS domain S-box-containing protein [Rhodothermales bacterium]|jgi:PAS domain S-box-containing protein
MAKAFGDYAVTSITPNVEQQLGYTQAAFLASPDFWKSHVHPDDREKAAGDLLGLFDTGHCVHEYRFQHKDGSYRWIRDDVTLLRDDAGAPTEIVGFRVDISESRQVKEKLRKSATLFEQAARLGDLGAWEYDEVESKFIQVSKEYAQILGVTVDEILAKYTTKEDDLGVVHPQDRDLYNAVEARAIERGESYDCEYRIIRSDGQVRHVHEAGDLVLDSTGRVTRSYGILQDITERKLAEDALRESDAMHEMAAHLAHLGYWVWDDVEDKLIKMSKECAEIYGISVDQAFSEFTSTKSNSEFNLIHPEDREEFHAAMKEAKKQTRPFTHEHRVVKPEGEVRYVREIGNPIVDEAGMLIRTLGTLQDITEQKKMQEALEESELRFKQAARVARLGHWHVDELKGEFTFISEEYARIHGYTVDEHMERFKSIDCDWNTVHPEDQARVRDVYKREVSAQVDFRIIRKDGNVCYIREVYWAVLDDSGTLIATYGTLQDITDIKQAEFELRTARDEAEVANTAKSRFLSRMSHELRTPMNAVLGFGQLLQFGDENLSNNQKAGVQHILTGGRQLLHLIDDVLDVSRVDSGDMNLAIESLDMQLALEESLLMVKSLAEDHKVKLNVPAKDACPVLADERRFKQVLVNLLSNAIKYNHEGGSVNVAIEPLDNGVVRISISDTGTGIKPENQADIFEPFMRVGGSIEEIQGAGLGLTISQRLVELMDGQIGFESQYGKGSTFWVELPQAQKPAPHIPL